MFTVTPIPAFIDNYIWMLSTPDQEQVVVVDPGDASKVLEVLERDKRSLQAILITHHHNDHTGGVAELLSHFNIPVYGPKNSPFNGITPPLSDGDSISVLGHNLLVREIPGHTLDHICYLSQLQTHQLFCGDTLFLAGCGRLFEGSPKQMLTAMQMFKTLPPSTEVYCTHEYSMANLAFALAVEPNNTEIQKVTLKCQQLRDNNQPTLPTSIGQECTINPFMRTEFSEVISAAEQYAKRSIEDEVDTFTIIREWKNQF